MDLPVPLAQLDHLDHQGNEELLEDEGVEARTEQRDPKVKVVAMEHQDQLVCKDELEDLVPLDQGEIEAQMDQMV